MTSKSTTPDLEDLDRQYAEEAAGTRPNKTRHGSEQLGQDVPGQKQARCSGQKQASGGNMPGGGSAKKTGGAASARRQPKPGGKAGGAIGLTEDELALEFTRRHRAQLRYVALWGAWMRWTGQRWEREPTHMVLDLARAVCRAAARGLNNAKLEAKIRSASTRAAVENLARSDRAHAAVPEQWDADPWVLNTPGGIVDLRTASISPHDPLAYHTKITAVAPGGGCSLWRDFLKRITDGDDDLQAYLQRSAGYALTGSIREHVLQFGYGTGANGKGTYLNTLTGIMGNYACTAPMETFTATTGERHPADLAMLHGARFVTAQETEQGRRWAEAKIKALTSGDPVSARFMRQDFFTFIPQFKLFIAGNHRPGLTRVDEAIRRRMHLVPFNVTIPEKDRDLELPDKLKPQWPGILAWMIDGCLAWQADGLDPPESVRAATEKYLAAEDTFEGWRDDCTTPDPTAWESSAALWHSWKRWAEAASEFVGTQKRFSQTLEERGFEPERQAGTGTRGYRGARLNQQDYTEDPRHGS